MRILVTGATGFIGNAIAAHFSKSSSNLVIGTTRQNTPAVVDGVSMKRVNDLGPNTDWSEALTDVDTVVHTAARVHVMNEVSNDAYAEYRNANVEGTRRLAEQAVEAGVKRFVFLSSIKVNGEMTVPSTPFTASSPPEPVDPYGKSKLEAESALLDCGRNTNLEVAIIRPPLVYGPGVGANFKSLISIVSRGVPLPLASVKNKRSLVFLGNLVDLIDKCTQDDSAVGQVFLASDGVDFSTPELINAIASESGKSARLFPMPVWSIRLAAAILGKTQAVDRLTSSLQVDITQTRELLSWDPPFTPSHGIAETVRSFQKKSNEEQRPS